VYGENVIFLTSSVLLIKPCDGRTDGQMDGRAIAYGALSIYAIYAVYMLSRSKNDWHNVSCSCVNLSTFDENMSKNDFHIIFYS